MRAKGANGVGRFSVDFEVANYRDMIRAEDGALPPEKIRRQRIPGIVDTGAAKLVLPQAVVKQLGLKLGDKIKVSYADGRKAQRQEAEGVFVELLGRHDTALSHGGAWHRRRRRSSGVPDEFLSPARVATG